MLLVASAPCPGVGQESREELVTDGAGARLRVDPFALLTPVDLEGGFMEVRWDPTLGPAHTAHWVLAVLQCGVGCPCLLGRMLSGVQPLRRYHTPPQQQARAAVGKPGGRDRVVFLEELAYQGRSWLSGCATRWVMGSIFRLLRLNGERAELIWGSKNHSKPTATRKTQEVAERVLG